MRFDFANYTPTQKRMTEAAVELFAAYGYAGTSMEKIATKSGFSAMHVQRVFKTKHNLFEAAVFYSLYRAGIRDAANGDGGGTFRAQITNFYRGYAKSLGNDPQVTRLVVYAGLDHPETIRRFLVEFVAPLYDHLLGIIQHGKHSGEVRKDVEPYAAIRALLGALIYHYIYTSVFRAHKLHKFHFRETDFANYLKIWLEGVS